MDPHAVRADHFVGLVAFEARAFAKAQCLIERQGPGLMADADADMVVGQQAGGRGGVIHGDVAPEQGVQSACGCADADTMAAD